jgi:hypothetical protein
MAKRNKGRNPGRRGTRSTEGGSFLEAYKRIRKPMPPPEQVLADRRRRTLDEDARHEIEEETDRRDRPDE